MAKVSIIVPVYNVAPYLHACIDSLIGQSLEDIEILCFDDCSDDGSAEILDSYAVQDARIQVIHYQENKTAAQARKDGTLMASGDYILYVDGDDALERDACKKLSVLMDNQRVDMIHFNSIVQLEHELPKERVDTLKKRLKPYKGKIDKNILNACFVENKFYFQIWNKIYSAKLCKKAMALFPDGRFSKAQDLFAFYLIAYFAQSYLGIPEQTYYCYGFGRGVTGHSFINRSTIDRYADQALVVQGITSFLKSMNSLEVNKQSLQAVERVLLDDSMSQMYDHISSEDIQYAFEKMCEKWGAPVVIGHMTDKQLYRSKQWAQQLKNCRILQNNPRKTKKIGTFYHSLYNGGAQRVVADLAWIWVRLGYEVVIFTDSEPTNVDYKVPDSVKRIVLPRFDLNQPVSRKQRAQIFYDSVKQQGIDLFIYHAWAAPSLLWDMLCVQLAGSLFYIHTHSIFSMPLLSDSITDRFFEMQNTYACADGIITLSNTDATYWGYYNQRVFTVINPLTFDVARCETNQLSGKTILWLGRIANEKYPVQAIEIFSKVHRLHPDAKMIMVGSGSDNLEKLIKRTIAKMELHDCVEILGFQANVESFYCKADVFLCTSQYEGFSLTIQEAQSHGIPVVVYDMPYLTLLERDKGCFRVPMCDKEAAAKRICMLFDHRELLRQAGQEARQNILDICMIDYQRMWNDIISSTQEQRSAVENSYELRVIQTLSTHMEMMIENSKKEGNRRYSGTSALPKHGPFKKLRRKMHTALRILILDGWETLENVIKEKMSG